MATLYELTTDYHNALDALDDCQTDDEVEALMMHLDAIEADIAGKGAAYVKVMRNMQSDIDAIDAELERLKARKARREKAVEHLKNGLKAAMDVAAIRKLETPLGTWSARTAPWSVTIIDEARVPDRFKVPQPPKVSKNLILDEFKVTGEVFEGIEMTRREYITFK